MNVQILEAELFSKTIGNSETNSSRIVCTSISVLMLTLNVAPKMRVSRSHFQSSCTENASTKFSEFGSQCHQYTYEVITS